MVSQKKAHRVIRCSTWDTLMHALERVYQALDPGDEETLWYRGATRRSYGLVPSLMRDTEGLSKDDHDLVEQDLFFEFQAHAADLRARNLTDWECMFFGRHYGVPTRVLDWTDTFGVALYFALETWHRDREESHSVIEADPPAIWAINPYGLNAKSWGTRDIVLPKYLGLFGDDFWDYGEMLASEGPWPWDSPVSVYPIQLNERVRAQRGWFTIHGNARSPLENQVPKLVMQLVLENGCMNEAFKFLNLAGFNRFSIYPDMENLASWIRKKNLDWIGKRKSQSGARLPERNRRPRQWRRSGSDTNSSLHGPARAEAGAEPSGRTEVERRSGR